MSDVLFVTWDGGGNLPPALGIACELRSRGHRVRFLGHVGQQAKVTGSGLDFTPYRHARSFTSARNNSAFAVIATFGDAGMGRDLLEELERQPADLVVVDCLLFGAMKAADRVGVPYVVLEHFFDSYFENRWLPGPMGLGVRLRGMRPRRSLDHAALRLVASLPALDRGATSRAANVMYGGPVVTGAPADPADPAHPVDAARPTVLVSLSTYAYPGQTRVMQNILTAVAGLDARVVATTGPVIDPDALRAPANVELHAWLPHAEVMPQVSLVVGHGGHATTMLALAHDVPLLILPMHPLLDQPMVGKAVEAAGAGRLMAKRSTPRDLRPVIGQLLAGGPHRTAAARLGSLIRERPGATTCADALEALVRVPGGR